MYMGSDEVEDTDTLEFDFECNEYRHLKEINIIWKYLATIFRYMYLCIASFSKRLPKVSIIFT